MRTVPAASAALCVRCPARPPSAAAWPAVVVAIGAVGALGALATPAGADNATRPSPVVAEAAVAPPAAAPLSKKQAYLEAKKLASGGAPAARLPRVGAPPTKVLSLFNTWTHEWIALDPAGDPAPSLVGRFLRCHFTNEPTEMDRRLARTLLAAARHFAAPRIHIVSGYRHPKYNLMLRKKGHEVARDSQHTHGHAVDFYVPGVSTKALHAWATAQGMGGVGLYVASGFVHMDTGPIRFWGGQ